MRGEDRARKTDSERGGKDETAAASRAGVKLGTSDERAAEHGEAGAQPGVRAILIGAAKKAS